MKVIFFILFTFITTLVFSQDSIVDYYNEITKSTEFTKKQNNPQRWETDIKIYIDGVCDSTAESELYKVVNELNDLIETIEIKIVNVKSDANLIAFFGFCSKYDKIEPKAIPYSGSNYGLFVVYVNNDIITNGSFYVDVVRCEWLDESLIEETKKHLVREELTQALGLYNDSTKYPNSIFYQEFSFTTEYTELDKGVIKMHYNR